MGWLVAAQIFSIILLLLGWLLRVPLLLHTGFAGYVIIFIIYHATKPKPQEEIGLKFGDEIIEETLGGYHVINISGDLVFRRRGLAIDLKTEEYTDPTDRKETR